MGIGFSVTFRIFQRSLIDETENEKVYIIHNEIDIEKFNLNKSFHR
jgi:hypothetical protein